MPLGSQKRNTKNTKKKRDERRKEEEAFYNNDELYEKYLNEAVDIAMKEPWSKNWGGRENIYDWFKYDDGDQGPNSSIELYKKSKEGAKLVALENEEQDSYYDYSRSCEKVIASIMGAAGDIPVSELNEKYTVNRRLSGAAQLVVEGARITDKEVESARKIYINKVSKEIEKNEKEGEAFYERYYKAKQKYTQDEADKYIDEHKDELGKLTRHINSICKEAEDKVTEAFGQEHAIKSRNKKVKNDNPEYLDAKLNSSKAYYDYSKLFDKTALEYIEKHYNKDEQELVKAAIFWMYMD